MRVVAIASLVAIVSGALCFWAGRSLAVPRAPEAAPESSPSSPRTSTRRLTASPLVCAKTRAPVFPELDCSEPELRARWCEAELDACVRERRAVRQEWPEADTIESPETWTKTIDEALASCDIGAELELVDCAEYPCTAALKTAKTAMTDAEHQAEMERLMVAVRSCPALRDQFGAAPDQKNLDVFRLDARCPNGRESFFVLMALDAAGAAYELYGKQERDDTQERDVNRWMYRRADDLAGMWPCGS
ncbi:MAG TPA: hypothetical protein VG755_33495 [Nannocystaceae bacterium]|nr:hypothetical protein [Nannocystaceae bacterium]